MIVLFSFVIILQRTAFTAPKACHALDKPLLFVNMSNL